MAHDVFLKIDGIEGESTDDKHHGWIRVLSFQHDIVQPLAGSQSKAGAAHGNLLDITAGRAAHGDFTVLKNLDRATPGLAHHCCTGKIIKKAVLEICDSSNNRGKIMEFVMSNVVIRSVKPHLGTIMEFDREAFTREQVALRYTRIEWIYTMLDSSSGTPKGNVHYYWDVEQNRGG